MKFSKGTLGFIFNRDFRRWLFRANKGLHSVFKRDYPRAIEEYKSILDDDVYSFRENITYRHLGEAYYLNGNIEEAEKALRKSLELNMKKKGHDPYLYKMLGDICRKKGQFQDALMFFEKTIQFGSKGLINKMMMILDMDDALKQKAFLEENKALLPFMTAYFQQNKHKFLKTKKKQ